MHTDSSGRADGISTLSPPDTAAIEATSTDGTSEVVTLTCLMLDGQNANYDKCID